MSRVRYCAPGAVHERLINSTTPSSGHLAKCVITMTDRSNYMREIYIIMQRPEFGIPVS